MFLVEFPRTPAPALEPYFQISEHLDPRVFFQLHAIPLSPIEEKKRVQNNISIKSILAPSTPPASCLPSLTS